MFQQWSLDDIPNFDDNAVKLPLPILIPTTLTNWKCIHNSRRYNIQSKAAKVKPHLTELTVVRSLSTKAAIMSL